MKKKVKDVIPSEDLSGSDLDNKEEDSGSEFKASDNRGISSEDNFSSDTDDDSDYISSSAKKSRPAKPNNYEQLVLLVSLMEKNVTTTVSSQKHWKEWAKILNKEGPCIKNGKSWSKSWYSFKKRAIKKQNKNATLTPFEEKAINIGQKSKFLRASNEQYQLIKKLIEETEEEPTSVKDETFWQKVSEELNQLGPSLKDPDEWEKCWFHHKKVLDRRERFKGGRPSTSEKPIRKSARNRLAQEPGIYDETADS